jgi:hypothetical protein
MSVLAQIASDDVLDTAYQWLCRRRQDYSANSDIWGFRRGWQREEQQIKDELLSGSFRFSLLSRITLKDGNETEASPPNAGVLPSLEPSLRTVFPIWNSI